MKITFGLRLDGQRSWHRKNLFGQATVGPMGFLSLLETFLGLPKPTESEAVRIIQYREAIAQLNVVSRFYHRSFEADQYAVARTLLGWRDTWYLHGWGGKFHQAAPKRLIDMAEIELQLGGKLSPCIGERLASIAEALIHRKHPIESVEIIDPIEDFPLSWQAVLHKLPLKQKDIAPPTSQDNNLTQLQRNLTCPTRQHLKWLNDDSVIVLRSHSSITSAKIVSQLANRNRSQTLFFAESEGALYDSISSAAGNSRLGISEKSELRPPLQLLSLAFALVWKPLNVFALLEFLAHPMSPLPRYASTILAESVASQPGIGGEKWNLAIKKIQEIADDKANDVIESIKSWLQMPRIPASDPAPIALLEDISIRVAKSFRARLGSDDYFTQRAQHSGSAQCEQITAALRLLKSQGILAINQLELSQLLEQTSNFSEGSPASRPEVESSLLATASAAIFEKVDTVVWWNMTTPIQPTDYPWHAHEISALHEAGVGLPDMSDVMEREARNWLRPILATQKQLILVLPKESEEVHPAWLSIEKLFEVGSIPILSGEDALENKLSIAQLSSINYRPLPQLRRWWHLKNGVIQNRKSHSFSSLEKFIHNPFEWVLRYPAQIRPPNILSISSGNMLMGSIAHRSVELLYAVPDALSWSSEQAVNFVQDQLQQLLEKEGAVLLLPGMRTHLEGFRQKLIVAVKTLHQHLQSAHAVLVEPEKAISGDFFMGELNGFIDILVTRHDGATAVVDMKWSRSKAYKEKLQKNRHLQLAIYGELIRQRTSKWSVPAYFILASGDLHAQERTFFPEAKIAYAKEDGGSAILWQKALETLLWRNTQIQNGMIELVVNDTDPDESSVWPVDALEVEEPSQWQSDYQWLAGWKADA